MKNTKKNTGAKYHISMHTEIRSGRIIQKINDIGVKHMHSKKRRAPFMQKHLKKHTAAQNFQEQTSCGKWHTIDLSRNGKKLRMEKTK